jgi:hypothetical protein
MAFAVREFAVGETEGNPCEALAHHGFNGINTAMAGAVAGLRPVDLKPCTP